MIETILLVIACLTTGVFGAMTLMMFLGIDEDGALDESEDWSEGSQYFTVRNLVHFIGGFAWISWFGLREGWPLVVALLAGAGVGLGLVVLGFGLMALLARIQSSGTVDQQAFVGAEGVAVIRIPEGGEGYGKIAVSVGSQSWEWEAITWEEEVRKGERVKVIGVDSGRLVVRRAIYFLHAEHSH